MSETSRTGGNDQRSRAAVEGSDVDEILALAGKFDGLICSSYVDASFYSLAIFYIYARC